VHILKHYACYGHWEFFIALGYKGDEIKRYFLDRARLRGDMTLRPARSEVLELLATYLDCAAARADCSEVARSRFGA
jgi:NDP-sugar pyrophosphorylase family protein